mmetsp:Transcript_53242/g.99908  ORF Transcript_53242/g.99908 Transcript_53242/m.99908 type:complete len:535 (+) Transcript_53242:60-1664(+)
MFSHGTSGQRRSTLGESLPDFLFGPEGLFASSGDVGRIVGNVTAGASFQWAGATPQTHADEGRSPTTHATSKKGLRALPKIKVTAYDREQNDSTECVICLGELVVGEPATRIPCGHLYHEECILAWLKDHNVCPVCRYELPTDDAEFEQGRKARMAGRRPRLRHADLKVKTAQELCRLAEHLNVDVGGCLEKAELVDRIVRSGKLEVVPEPQHIHISDLSSKTPHQLRRLAEQLRVDIRGCLEKDELINSLIASGRIEVDREPLWDSRDLQDQDSSPSLAHKRATSSPSLSSPCLAQQKSAPSPSQSSPSLAQLRAMSVHDIKELMRRSCLEMDGCLEKEDLIQRVMCSHSPLSRTGMGGAQSVASRGDGRQSLEELDATSAARCSIAHLRKVARSRGILLDGCLEKREIIERILGEHSSHESSPLAGDGEVCHDSSLVDALDELAATCSGPSSRPSSRTCSRPNSRPSSRPGLRHAGTASNASDTGELSHLAHMGNLHLRSNSRPGSAASSTMIGRHSRSDQTRSQRCGVHCS